MVDSVYNRLRIAREALGFTQTQMAEAINVTRHAIQANERGKNLPGGKIITGYVRLGINANWLLTGDGPMRLEGEEAEAHIDMVAALAGDTAARGKMEAREADVLAEVRRKTKALAADSFPVPCYAVEASLGNGKLLEHEEIVDYWPFKATFLIGLGVAMNKLAIVTARGDSMEPTIIDGDLLLVDRSQRQVARDAVYVLRLGPALYAKRLQKKASGAILIKSDNPAYETEIVQPSDSATLKVIGRVVWYGRRV